MCGCFELWMGSLFTCGRTNATGTHVIDRGPPLPTTQVREGGRGGNDGGNGTRRQCFTLWDLRIRLSVIVPHVLGLSFSKFNLSDRTPNTHSSKTNMVQLAETRVCLGRSEEGEGAAPT